MGITAKARAKTALTATTSLEPAAALAVVKAATGDVKGGGKSLLTSGLVNAGAMVNVEAETPERLGLSITSGKRLFELCTFSAHASSSGGGTTLVVGGLESYKTSQSKFLFLIPTGPKSITGYDPYRRYLTAVEAALKTNDPGATVTIAQPETA